MGPAAYRTRGPIFLGGPHQMRRAATRPDAALEGACGHLTRSAWDWLAASRQRGQRPYGRRPRPRAPVAPCPKAARVGAPLTLLLLLLYAWGMGGRTDASLLLSCFATLRLLASGFCASLWCSLLAALLLH